MLCGLDGNLVLLGCCHDAGREPCSLVKEIGQEYFSSGFLKAKELLNYIKLSHQNKLVDKIQ